MRMTAKKAISRNEEIRRLAATGETYRAIGRCVGLSGAMVGRIVNGGIRHHIGPATDPAATQRRASLGARALHAQGKTSTSAATQASQARFHTREDFVAYMTLLSLRGVAAKAAGFAE